MLVSEALSNLFPEIFVPFEFVPSLKDELFLWNFPLLEDKDFIVDFIIFVSIFYIYHIHFWDHNQKNISWKCMLHLTWYKNIQLVVQALCQMKWANCTVRAKSTKFGMKVTFENPSRPHPKMVVTAILAAILKMTEPKIDSFSKTILS